MMISIADRMGKKSEEMLFTSIFSFYLHFFEKPSLSGLFALKGWGFLGEDLTLYQTSPCYYMSFEE